MYGGGFATIPAYLADLFGTQHVGAIHGRLLTAWSAAGILGPVVVNYIREFQLARGLPADQAYNVTMYILAAFLLAGLICNLLVRPVAERHFMTEAELAAERAKAHERPQAAIAAQTLGNAASHSLFVGRSACVAGGRIAPGLGNMDHADQGVTPVSHRLR